MRQEQDVVQLKLASGLKIKLAASLELTIWHAAVCFVFAACVVVCKETLVDQNPVSVSKSLSNPD